MKTKIRKNIQYVLKYLPSFVVLCFVVRLSIITEFMYLFCTLLQGGFINNETIGMTQWQWSNSNKNGWEKYENILRQ